MNITDELEREIAEDEDDVYEELPTFELEELPAPTRQMTIYGMIEKGLHVDG